MPKLTVPNQTLPNQTLPNQTVRTLRRLLLLGATSVALLLVGVTAAEAHVTVSSSSTAPGSYATLTFRIPTESETASTDRLTVQLPTETPFTAVLTQPAPGWAAKTETSKLATPTQDDDGRAVTSAVTKVVWTATGDGIKPGEFSTLTLLVGPLPTEGTLYLPTVQHYSDGSEVGWVQQAQNGAEAEHPAPSVAIAPAPAPAPVAVAGPATGSGLGIGLGIAGLALGLVAVGLGGAALARTRRAAPPPSAHP